MSSLRRWSRTIHRELSFFLSGMVLIYAISGLVMNHRDTINPNYTVKRTTFTIDDLKPRAQLDRQEVVALLERSSIGERYTKHYFPEEGRMKVFLKGGSSLEVDLATGQAVYESLRKRPIIGSPHATALQPRTMVDMVLGLFRHRADRAGGLGRGNAPRQNRNHRTRRNRTARRNIAPATAAVHLIKT